MSEEKFTPNPERNPAGVDSDPLDELISEMLLRRELNAVEAMDDFELEKLSDAEDAEAVPFSLDLVHSGVRQQELPTQFECDETIANSEDELVEEDAVERFHDMFDKFDRFEKQDCLTFQCGYRKVGILGCGGQGVVHQVEGNDEFSAVYALKAFKPIAYRSLDDFTVDMKRMHRIASLIHREPHDDLVDVGWFGQRDGVYTMKMQYIDGFDLRRLVRNTLLPAIQGCVSPQRFKDINNVIYAVNGSWQLTLQPAIAVYIVERVLRGLGAMHARGIVHGDIKPSNIMLNASGSVKIVDVGSAFEEHSRPEKYHFSPAYAAPEFLETAVMSRQSDLASVGYMLVELLSGKPITKLLPNTDESTMEISMEMKQKLLTAKQSLPDRLSQILPPNVLASDHLVELCRCLIAPDLEQRFPSAAESIVDRKGTYEFNKDLVLSNLSVCNYHEISQWLADVKTALSPQAQTK